MSLQGKGYNMPNSSNTNIVGKINKMKEYIQ